MKSFLQGAAAFFFVVLAGCALTLTFAARDNLKHSDLVLRHLDLAIGEIELSAVNAEDAAYRVLEKTEEIQDSLGQTSKQVNAASAAELKYWNLIGKNSADATRDLRVLISKTDRALNDHTLPNFDNELILTADAAQASLGATQHAGEALTARLNDPAIAQLAANLNTSAANLADATKHTDAATADIEEAVHRLTRPPSMLKRIGTTLLGIGAQLGSIFAGFVK